MKDLHVHLLQLNLHWESPGANRTLFEEAIKQILGPKQIVFLPETFTTGFSMHPLHLAETMEGETIQWMKQIAGKYGIILCGTLMIEEKGSYFNRLIWMQPDQQYVCYDKRHLFSYGGEGDLFQPGIQRQIVRANGWKICLMICYDLRFPVWSRLQQTDEYDILVYLANWPEKRINAWNTLLRARAIENQCYVLGVNRCGLDGNGMQYNGQSVIINPVGEIIEKAGAEPTVLYSCLPAGSVQDIRSQFPFSNDKDLFEIIR